MVELTEFNWQVSEKRKNHRLLPSHWLGELSGWLWFARRSYKRRKDFREKVSSVLDMYEICMGHPAACGN